MSTGDAWTFASGEEMLTLRRDIIGLRQALRSSADVKEAQAREIERYRAVIRALALETERHRLAVERLTREIPT